ncbi:uncharacterized protein UV8b_04870 [Ustilaginoidea virens]|uniref:Nucleotide-diphospho-sugar transferase n=1 Tax=Ustilaginoidea virens TaxID=1159556 RepID=A0A8E5HS45_USTVR|nr:uncharacterized protein UV8b_04870 [Ustilaginoidea virens]QUC20629.1 hypothetical protein UV8b_04870 [Ustilaginoidea virens]
MIRWGTPSSKRFCLAASSLITLVLLGAFYSRQARTHAPAWNIVSKDLDWSKFAYVQYVTNSDYLCNSVMLFETLDRLGSRADRVMLYPESFPSSDDDARLLIKAQVDYKVRLQPVQIQHRAGSDATWEDSFTKLLAFNQTDYSRVLSLDSDATVLKAMDELFLLPPSPVAMPRAYWLYPDKQMLTSTVMLVQPSVFEFERVADEIAHASGSTYDMEIANKLYGDQAMVLPHRPYVLLTAEFRSANHSRYLGPSGRHEKWDPDAVLDEARYLHFSDWPVPKPWVESRQADKVRDEMQPRCWVRDGVEDCRERELWHGFYADFAARRRRVCR